MSTTATATVEEVRRGDVIRFLPLLHSRRVTVHVTHAFDGVGIAGYRASFDGATLSTRGEAHAYFARPGTEVELLRRA